ncbi:hypothetical protein V6N13_053293 [Hibiscus sabdariffa]|uniref:Uncharacterized protein n=2 Tax=Hibiscus sabdariffa TaxID=183260 RepID=A0ABR2ASM0_9ROSI
MDQIIIAVPGVVISNGVTLLLESIKKARKTTKRFKPLLNHLKDTVTWITPRVEEIRRSTESHEIQRLLNLLAQAKVTVDKSSKISSWNIRKKYKFAKELIELDSSIRTTRVLKPKSSAGVVFDLIREKLVHSQPAEVVSDIALWKRKKISGSLLVSSTATWLLQQVYEHKFLTVASWVAIFVVTSLFIWRYVNRFLDREEASKSRMDKLREQFVLDISNACWEVTDEVTRWIFDATDVEAEWSVFPQTIAYLLLFAYAGSFIDLPTLCGVVMTGTTVPVMVANHGYRIKPVESLVGKVCEMLAENLTNTMKNNIGKEGIKQKKIKKQN